MSENAVLELSIAERDKLGLMRDLLQSEGIDVDKLISFPFEFL
jgi:hypothetical protein